MNYTIAARDNLILRAEGDCMYYLEVVADLANDSFERNREAIARSMSELVCYGQTSLVLH